jgi:hypothetical protein
MRMRPFRWGFRRREIVTPVVDAFKPLFGTPATRLRLGASDMVGGTGPASLRHAARNLVGGTAGQVVDLCAPHIMGSDMSFEQVSVRHIQSVITDDLKARWTPVQTGQDECKLPTSVKMTCRKRNNGAA